MSILTETLKLYHSQMESFTGSDDNFVVAHNEDQAKDIVYSMYGGKNGGYKKDKIYVSEIEVDGYEIQVKQITPKIK